MQLPRDIRNNLRFLIAEVESQVAGLRDGFSAASVTDARRLLERSGYAYNLMQRVHESCRKHSTRRGKPATPVAVLRALETIATELERISGLCRACVGKMEQLQRKRWRGAARFAAMLEDVVRAVSKVEAAVRSNDTRLALKIGMAKPRLDRAYNRLLKKHLAGLRKRAHTEDQVTSLFMAHGVNQMGDALLDISEAIISANLGQPMNIDSYSTLQESIGLLDVATNPAAMVVEPLAKTRSGSGISAISLPDGCEGEYMAVYKDGRKRKLRDERKGLKRWQQMMPGLTPRVLSYHKRGQSASLMIEHLAGLTFEQVLLHESAKLLQESLAGLHATMARVWRETMSPKPVAAGFMRQLSRRLEDVYMIHPEFRQRDSRLCGHASPSFGTLLKKAHAREARISAPFSVYIHGDFNVDNIIYDRAERKISFIDLHRSRYMDYVQDVSVFMVSNYRLQIFDAPMRRRILALTHEFYRFAAAFARESGDSTFEMRLALGLARSFATSTRFILDKSLAKAMFLRSRYLLERVLATRPDDAASFRVPVREIFIG